jgi:hypothetical protein
MMRLISSAGFPPQVVLGRDVDQVGMQLIIRKGRHETVHPVGLVDHRDDRFMQFADLQVQVFFIAQELALAVE